MRAREIVQDEWERSDKPYSGVVTRMGRRYRALGSGETGTVYQDPGEPRAVLKVFANDRGYAEWLRWMMAHPGNRWVPKVITRPGERPVRMLKYRDRGMSQRIAMVRLERLERMTYQEIVEFSRWIVETYMEDPQDRQSILRRPLTAARTYLDYMGADDWEEVARGAASTDPQLSEVAQFFSDQERGNRTRLDLNDNNIMRRPGGDVVFTDPLVGGSPRRPR